MLDYGRGKCARGRRKYAQVNPLVSEFNHRNSSGGGVVIREIGRFGGMRCGSWGKEISLGMITCSRLLRFES